MMAFQEPFEGKGLIKDRDCYGCSIDTAHLTVDGTRVVRHLHNMHGWNRKLNEDPTPTFKVSTSSNGAYVNYMLIKWLTDNRTGTEVFRAIDMLSHTQSTWQEVCRQLGVPYKIYDSAL